jgi:hypothetical protein
VPAEQKGLFQGFKKENNGPFEPNLSNCLLITTDIAFEIWLLKPSSLQTTAAELECIYRKKEDGVEMLDFLHVNTRDQNIPNFHIHNLGDQDQPRKNSNASEESSDPRIKEVDGNHDSE